MEPADATDALTATHFTILVYAFQHGCSGRERLESFRALDGRWHHWWSRLDDQALATALDDTYFFLPHVHRVLFPETQVPTDGDPRDRVTASRRFSRLPLDEVARRVAPDAALRLTCDPGRLDPLRHVALSFLRRDHDGTVLDQFEAPFEIDWVDAVLFPQQVGLLILKVRLSEPTPTVTRINDFHYYLRPVHPPTIDWQLADWRTTAGTHVVSCKTRDVLDYLLQGLAGPPDPRSRSLELALADFQRPGEATRPTQTPFGNVYGQSFHLYHYSCLAGSEPPDWPSGPFDSPSERALFELATCTDTRIPDYRPDPKYLNDLMSRHRIALWENWKGLALHDNAAFLGLVERRFTLDDLPHNIENDYLYLYIITLFYKLRLSLIAGEMMGREGRLEDRVRRARRLSEDFRSFQDDYWFGEVTPKPQGIAIHQRFRDGLGLSPIFEELRTKVREYQEFHELKIERRVSDLLALLTFIWAPAGALCSLFGAWLAYRAEWPDFVAALLGVWGVLGVVWMVWTHRDEILEDYHETYGEGQGRRSR